MGHVGKVATGIVDGIRFKDKVDTEVLNLSWEAWFHKYVWVIVAAVALLLAIITIVVVFCCKSDPGPNLSKLSSRSRFRGPGQTKTWSPVTRTGRGVQMC